METVGWSAIVIILIATIVSKLFTKDQTDTLKDSDNNFDKKKDSFNGIKWVESDLT